MEGNLDWRSFGSITYNEMKEVGLFDRIKKKISFYNNARTNITRHKAVICSSELPLSEVASRLLDTKMRVVELIMDGIEKDPGGGVGKLSKLATLQLLMKKGLERENVSLTLIRKYCRLVTAYYIAYIDGKDIIQAESWIKKHRSHRGHSGTMDEKLYKLYFPYGVDNDEHINDDELALHDNMIEYINDNVTHDDELDTWLNMLDNYQRSGRII
jgi:hypothetical protein